MPDRLEHLRIRLAEFARQRAWEQFHTPRNLVLALVGEVGEVASEVRFLDDHSIEERLKSDEFRTRLADEMADVFIFLLGLAEVCDIDLADAANSKIDRNEERYSVQVSKGNAQKQPGKVASGLRPQVRDSGR